MSFSDTCLTYTSISCLLFVNEETTPIFYRYVDRLNCGLCLCNSITSLMILQDVDLYHYILVQTQLWLVTVMSWVPQCSQYCWPGQLPPFEDLTPVILFFLNAIISHQPQPAIMHTLLKVANTADRAFVFNSHSPKTIN